MRHPSDGMISPVCGGRVAARGHGLVMHRSLQRTSVTKLQRLTTFRQVCPITDRRRSDLPYDAMSAHDGWKEIPKADARGSKGGPDRQGA
jgi:hypothetical protein